MALILRALIGAYRDGMKYADPRVEDWFLTKSIFPVAGFVAFYLYFVTTLGPHIMKHRKPFNIDKILVVYNAIQVGICAYLLYSFFKYCVPEYNFWCEPVDYVSERGLLMAEFTWIFYMLKVADLLDTVFFVLRKKQSQVTFLHLYHHAGMVLTSWFGTRFIPGGTVIYTGGLNSFVHVVMYTYYLLTVWDKSLKENVRWKKHITRLQLAQFCIIFCQHTQLLFRTDCAYPKVVSMFMAAQTLTMIILFGDFYVKVYVKKKGKIDETIHPSRQNNGMKHK